MVTVMAVDPGNAGSTVVVTITVLNVNESPKFVEDTNNQNLESKDVSETETGPAMQFISGYMATDDENAAPPTVDLEWSLSGPDADKFDFYDAQSCASVDDNATGASVNICLKAIPDFEARGDANGDNIYSISVDAKDSDDNTTSRNVAVTIENEEEGGTVELSNIQPEVGVQIEAELSDPDGGIRDVTWKWLHSTMFGSGFTPIPGATSKTYVPTEAYVNNYIVAEATYRNAATQDDPFTPDMDESLKMATSEAENGYAVMAADTTAASPTFPDQDPNTQGVQSDTTTRSVFENVVSGDDVGLPVLATANQQDDGSTNSMEDALTYTLGGTDESSFKINRESGQITLANGVELDHETKDTYTVTVTATDPSLDSATITVVITVNDVDEPPEISKRGLAVSGNRSVSYEENETADVASYRATGSDSTGASWSLEGPDASAFAISSGVLAFRSSPNYESPTDQDGDNAYEVTVKATMGSLMATRNVTVTVTDVNEDGGVTISSPNNEVKVGVVLTADLGDGDEIVPGSVTWQWARDSSQTGSFTDVISGETNNTYTPVDADVGSYLRATATYADSHGSGMTEMAETDSAVLAASTAGTDGTVGLSRSSGIVSGDSVTATLTDPDNPTNQVWQWQRSSDGSTNWSTISGATSASYETTNDDGGHYLRASVTYDDSSDTGQTAGPAATTDSIKLHRYDNNANGSIDRPEVINAINAYLFGSGTTRDEVIEVINLFLFG